MKGPSHRVHTARPLFDYTPRMEPTRDGPLPATLAFVFSLGGLILIGWFAMYVLLRARW